MADNSQPPRVAIFSPDPLLSVTIEARGQGDEVHVHAAGQGPWVARMAAELGATPVLCSLLGGETGAMLRPLLEAIPAELCGAETAGGSGSYVVDRRGGERKMIASALRAAPARHEVDDLLTAGVAAALTSDVMVVCNPYPAEGLQNEVYETLVADVRAAGIPVLVDLSSPRLDRTLRYSPDLVKLNDWELAAYVRGPVEGPQLVAAARKLRAAGAQTVVVTRAGAPTLVLPRGEEPFEVVPPEFPVGHREGCGDTMMGAIAVAWAMRQPLRHALALGTAAGSVNFLRHGLGTGKREVVQALAEHVVMRPLSRGLQVARTAA